MRSAQVTEVSPPKSLKSARRRKKPPPTSSTPEKDATFVSERSISVASSTVALPPIWPQESCPRRSCLIQTWDSLISSNWVPSSTIWLTSLDWASRTPISNTKPADQSLPLIFSASAKNLNDVPSLSLPTTYV